jgi:RNA polymerase sigma factor (sigma-70 family)
VVSGKTDLAVLGAQVREDALPASEQVNDASEVLALPGHLAGFPEEPSGETLTSVDFEEFVRSERSKLVWFLMSHGASLHEAEEAAQASLIEAWRKWETIISPRGWVYRVALREYWRSAPKPGASREELTAEPPDHASVPSAGDMADITARERLVCTEIARLPAQQRQVAVLRYEGYTNREIAEQLGVDASAVRHNVLRAKSRLRHLQENRQEDAG